MITKRSIIKNKLKLIAKFFASFFHSIFLFLHKAFKLIGRPFKKLYAKILVRLPHTWRVRIYNFQKKLHGHRRVKIAGGIALASMLVIVLGVFIWNQYNNNKKFATDIPYNEKVADGAWILRNQEPVHEEIVDSFSNADLNLKEVVNVRDFVKSAEASEVDSDIAKPFDTLKYKWVVTISDGTHFEFGGVNADTPDGAVLPVVRVRNDDGAYLIYAPSIINNSKFSVSSSFVSPKVEGNVISWDLASGVTARYTMQQDRVKADYIIRDKESLSNYDLNFDFEYDGGELIQMPDGEIVLSTRLEEKFRIPLPEITDSKKVEFNGTYELANNQNGEALISIILPPDKLSQAKFPLNVDPVIVSTGNTGQLDFANGRNLIRDAYGNLIVVMYTSSQDLEDVYYKNYDASSWVSAGISFSNYNNNYCRYQNIASDIDGSGDIHLIAWLSVNTGFCGVASDRSVVYNRLNIRRDSGNRISNIIVSDVQTLDKGPTEVSAGARPSLTIANKGAGVGKEKVVVAYDTMYSSPTDRAEFRVLQKDVWNVGYEDMILDDPNLVGYWRLNERRYNEVAYDISPTGNDGTYNGTPIMGASPAAILGDSENTAVTFDSASSEYISVSDASDVYSISNTGELSVEGWFKVDPSASSSYIVTKDANTNEEWRVLYNGSTDYLLINLYEGATVRASCGSPDYSVSDDKWYHFALTMDEANDEARLYMDGVEVCNDTSWIGSPVSDGQSVYIGQSQVALPFSGEIDEMAIYSDILTPTEIQQHYAKGRETNYSNVIKATPGLAGYWRLGTASGTIAYDDSGNGTNGTYINSPTLGSNGATGSDYDTAVTLDGSTQYISISDNSYSDFGTGDFSVETWVKRSGQPAGTEYLVAQRGNNNVNDWELRWNASTDQLSSRLWDGTDSVDILSDNSVSISDNRWHHIVLTVDRDGSGIIYKDGKASGEYDVSSVAEGDFSMSNVMYIGRRESTTGCVSGNCYFEGGIDEVAVYKGVALTPDQVREHYQAANDWKNVSEEINSNGSFENCADTVTRGEAGFGATPYCKGTADAVNDQNLTWSPVHGLVNQIPGSPARTPDSVKWDDNGSFSNLTNSNDGDRTTTNSINGFTTADYLYIGDSKPFSKVTVDMFATNSATADFALTDVEYCSLSYDGSTCTTWSDLANFYDNTDNATSAFSEDGSLLFDEPDNWATVTINSTSGKYWIRVRPDAAMDSDVSIAEITVNDRNSNALIVMVGATHTEGLQPATVPWDDITNDTWENRPDSVGSPWWEGDVSGTGFWGFGFPDDRNTSLWTYCISYALSSTIDYSNNRFYTTFNYDDYGLTSSCIGNMYLYTFSVGNNKDPMDRNNWIDAQSFQPEGPDNKGFQQPDHVMTTDGKDLYIFVNPDINSSTQSAYFVKCTPYKSGDPNICDGANDWGSNVNITDTATQIGYIEAIATKATSDISALDYLYNVGGTLYHDRTFTELNDKKVVTANIADDGFMRDCSSGTDDMDYSWTGILLGHEETESQCDSSMPADFHAGFRFQGVDIAPGAKISSAYIDLQSINEWGAVLDNIAFTIYGEDEDNAAAIPGSANCTDPCTDNLRDRTRTTSSYSHDIDFIGANTNNSGEGVMYRFDVTDLVQEIVCRGVINTQPCVGNFNGSGAWASGNDLGILMITTETDENFNEFASYDNTTSALKPRLVINCADSCDEPKPQESNWCDLGGGGNFSNDCNNKWLNRKKITFDNRASAENLTDFPALIRLDSTKIDYSKVQNAGQDLRFVDATGGAVLRYDIDEWDENGESTVWVKVPQIDAASNTDYIYMYYNNASASAGLDPPNTWNSTYQAVWHLNEDPSTTCNTTSDEFCDSTANNIDGDQIGTMTSADKVNGIIGSAINFDGVDDGADFGSGTNLFDSTGPVAFGGWVNLTSIGAATNIYPTILSLDTDQSTGFIMFFESTAGIRFGSNSNFVYADLDDYTASDFIGKWTHVMLVFNGGSRTSLSNYTLYINGKSVNFTANTIGTIDNENVIGADTDWTDSFFPGLIDEMRVSAANHSEDWVEAEYLNTRPGSNFVSIGSEEKDPTVSAYESKVIDPGNLAAYYKLDEPNNYTEFIQSLNPDGYWPLDDHDGNFRDASGNGFSATVTGDPKYARDGPIINGIAQSAIEFDGSDYAFVDESIDDSVTAAGGMTISFWMRTTSTSEVVLGQYSDSGNRGWDMWLGAGGTINIEAFQTDGINYYCDIGHGTIVNDGNWHHVAAFIDNTNGYCHVNVDGGTWVTDNTVSGTWNAEIDQPLAIGSSSLPNLYYTGDIAHVAYWDHDISKYSIGTPDPSREALYDGFMAADSSGNGYHMVSDPGSGPFPGVKGLLPGESDNTAFSFDGTGDYVWHYNNLWNPWTSDFSINAWVTSDSNDTNYKAAVSSETYLTNGFRFGRRGDDLAFWTDQSGGDVVLDSTSLFSAITTGVPYMITVTRTGDDFYFYVNGELAASDTAGSYTAPSSTVDTWIGQVPGGNWGGDIDEVSIYTDVLTAEEIADMYETGSASHYQKTILDTSGLVGYWRLGEGGGTTAYDSSSTGNDGTYTNSPTLGISGALKGDNDKAFETTSGTDYLSIPDHNALDVGDTFSVEFWVNQGGDYTRDYVNKGTNGFFIWRDGADDTIAFSKNGGGNIAKTTSTLPPNEGVWHHVVWTKDGSETHVYFDGQEDTNPGTNATVENTASAMGVGGDGVNGTDAGMDELAIYNVALSGDQVREHYLAGGGTNRYNTRQFSKGVTTATGSASFSDLDSKFSSADYVAVAGDDETYVDISSDLNVHASTSAEPTFMLKVNNARNKNTDNISATAVVRSTAPTTTNPIYLQVYRAGNFDNWVTIASDKSSKANTDITLSGYSIATNTNEYYINETSGVGSQGNECTNNTSNCWTYFRVYQEGVGEVYNTILSLDSFNTDFSGSRLTFTNAHNYFTTNTCSGVAKPFVLEIQDTSGNSTFPSQPTVVKLTSSSGGTVTYYSDFSCSTPITNGELTFDTNNSSKTIYINDTGISNDYSLTAEVLSGDSLNSTIHYYTIEAGDRLDSRTRIKGGGDTRIRGGTRFR